MTMGESAEERARRWDQQLDAEGGGDIGMGWLTGGGNPQYPPKESPGIGRKWQYSPSANMGVGGWISVEDPNYRGNQRPIPGTSPGEEEFSAGQIITMGDGSQWYYTYDNQGNPIPHLFKEAATQPTQREAPEGQPVEYYTSSGVLMRWNPWMGNYVESGYDPNKDVESQRQNQPPPISEYQQRDLDLERQRLEQSNVNEQRRLAADEAWRQQQLQSEKEARLASLRASPTSWLEYASLSGQAPVVQPWMTGLLPQGSNLGIGQQIPGFNPGQQKMDLPELLRPSAQYSARMGPVPQKQYLGYEQARTGAPPEQTAWYQSQTSAPAGRFGTLSRRR